MKEGCPVADAVEKKGYRKALGLCERFLSRKSKAERKKVLDKVRNHKHPALAALLLLLVLANPAGPRLRQSRQAKPKASALHRRAPTSRKRKSPRKSSPRR
jgi:hypothetical protein